MAGCTATKQSQNSPSTISVTYQLKQGDHSLGTKQIKSKKNAKVISSLRKVWPVKTHKGMVTEIRGYKQNPKKNEYWLYTVNGKTAKKGVEQQTITKKSKIVFTLEKMSE